ncbi:ABC transporter substrate-binding protein [Microbacterium xanthum]|uniref:ABC transporter substrate-binding protein n=1 Tax=Microbacterium xanthum TaxID=3079794 RepID=UPI002AD29AF2|nr:MULTISPECIES: extracellular solute-binding protein [unclassified Microbacterium]MDZ8173009.1 extracellular solute-binding protein [Microbacterium sp. KSW-48]MDZ8200833.1 extracellular solute-binding protein [Microbacterium sp. SSW1-59]
MTSRPTITARPRKRMVAAGSLFTAAALAAITGCAAAEGGTAQTADPDAEVTLNFAWWGDASRADRYEAAIDLWEERNPNVTIQTSYAGSSDYWTARNTEAASRSLPDVFQMDLAYLAEYGGFEHALPLDDYLGDVIDTSAIDPALIEAGAYNDKIYGLTSSSGTLGMMLNKPLLDELGVAAPEGQVTWDEYDELMAEVAAAGAASDPAVYGATDYTQDIWLFQIWLGQQGLSFIDEDGIGFDAEDLAAWWSRSAPIHESGGAMPMQRQSQLEGVDAIGSEEVATGISWAHFLPRFSEGPATPELTLAPVPFDDADNTGMFLKPGLMLSIGANSEHPAHAAEFIDFLVNDPEVGTIFGMSRGVPASTTAADGIEANAIDQEILDYHAEIEPLLNGTLPPAARGFGTQQQVFITLAQEVAYGSVSPDEAAERWFAEAESAMG